jgi:gliding motility-associated-like protein
VYAEACPPLSVEFIAETTPVVSCLWDFGDGNISTDCGLTTHTYTETGCYDVSITVVSAEGCSNTAVAPQIACVFPVPEANFAFSPDPVSEFYTDVQFYNLTTNGNIFNWTIEGGFPSSSTATHPSTLYPPETPGEYPVTLIAENEFGCIDTAHAVVIVFPDVLIYVPNAFTPDGNQHNNRWKPSIIGIDDVGYKLLVFNRWGELVWESTDLNESWDGNYKNIRVKEGTYVWKLEAVQRHTKETLKWTGHVNVLY